MSTNACHRDGGPGAPVRVLLSSPRTGAGMLPASGRREGLPVRPEKDPRRRRPAVFRVALTAWCLGLGCCWGLMSPRGSEESVPCRKQADPGGGGRPQQPAIPPRCVGPRGQPEGKEKIAKLLLLNQPY